MLLLSYLIPDIVHIATLEIALVPCADRGQALDIFVSVINARFTEIHVINNVTRSRVTRKQSHLWTRGDFTAFPYKWHFVKLQDNRFPGNKEMWKLSRAGFVPTWNQHIISNSGNTIRSSNASLILGQRRALSERVVLAGKSTIDLKLT